MLSLTNRSGRQLPAGAEETFERAAAAALDVGWGALPGDPAQAWADVTIVGDAEIRELNRVHLGIDEITDVLAFSLLEGGPEPDVRGGPAGLPLGDVVVSADRAFVHGEEYGHGFLPELALLVVHGVLHLLGYGDETPGQRARMREMEREALAGAGVSVRLPDD